jgi:aminoglycoside 3'-phosphotransferase-2
MSDAISPDDAPQALRPYWDMAREIAIGRSGDRVFRLRMGRYDTVVKVSAHGGSLEGEALRLLWLAEQRAPAPAMMDLLQWKGRAWLLMKALPGADAATVEMEPARLVALLAQALRELHAFDPASCPFDQRLDVKLAQAAENVRLGTVDETDFDDDHLGMSAGAVLARAQSLRPASEDIVVAHGDACLPNFMIDRGAFAGFVDCGRLGRADRWQDLALAARSITQNLGADFVAPFFAAYGVERDAVKAYFYRLLDEFF